MEIPKDSNRNGQKVVRATGMKSVSHYNQKIYELRCTECGYRYVANGCDVHIRKCPKHQNGARGEPLS